MSGPQRVTAEQRSAARLRVVLDDRLGRPTPDWVRRMANTPTVAPALAGAGLMPTADRQPANAGEAAAWEFLEKVSQWFATTQEPAAGHSPANGTDPDFADASFADADFADAAAWANAADAGWAAAAQTLAEPSGEETEAGLPRRRPGAHLVPGTAAISPTPVDRPAAPAPSSGAPEAPAVPDSAVQGGTEEAVDAGVVRRSADAVRERMSRLQSGTVRGRDELLRSRASSGMVDAEG